MIAKDRDDGNPDGRQFFHEGARLFRQPVIRQIAGKGEDVRRLRYLLEKTLERAGGRGPAVMDIGKRSDADDVLLAHAPANGSKLRAKPGARTSG